jgi:hypothetical protein
MPLLGPPDCSFTHVDSNDLDRLMKPPAEMLRESGGEIPAAAGDVHNPHGTTTGSIGGLQQFENTTRQLRGCP